VRASARRAAPCRPPTRRRRRSRRRRSRRRRACRGHGTQAVDESLVATVAGVVGRVNKLVTVTPPRSRYAPQVGDVVVGRVAEVAGKRWRVDLAARQDAALLLSAVTLPGGAQRRRTAEDELAMRGALAEGDLLSAEVQALQHDGAVMLQTRSAKYGRLLGGQLVRVPADLVKRQKAHFLRLEAAAVDLVIGCNGLIWVAPAAAAPAAAEGGDAGAAPPPPPTAEGRLAAARAARAVEALALLGLPVHLRAVEEVFRLSAQAGAAPKDMLGGAFLAEVAAQEGRARAAEGAGAA
jgi:exosome complex component RRP4